MKNLATILCTVALFASCTEKNIYLPEHGTLAGYIRPAVEGATIRLADGSVSTAARDDGFFVLKSVPEGVHDIVVEAEGFTKRVLHGVTVVPAQTRSLGTVTLSTYPYPIFRTLPEGGDQLASSITSFGFSCDERMDLESLSELASVSPSIVGIWSESEPQFYEYAPSYYHYLFRPIETGFAIQTMYAVVIPSGVRTYRGETLGRTMSVSFTTQPFSANINVRGYGNPPIVPLRDFEMTITFNAPVHVDSLRKATIIDPPIDGVWRISSGGAVGYIIRFNDATHATLKPNTSYAVVVRDEIFLSDSFRLRESVLKTFTTGGFEVVGSDPGMNRTIDSGDTLLISFNSPADTDVTIPAISVTRTDGAEPGVSISWSEDLMDFRIVADNGWDPSHTYRIYVSHDAQSVYGPKLSYEYISYFYVR